MLQCNNNAIKATGHHRTFVCCSFVFIRHLMLSTRCKEEPAADPIHPYGTQNIIIYMDGWRRIIIAIPIWRWCCSYNLSNKFFITLRRCFSAQQRTINGSLLSCDTLLLLNIEVSRGPAWATRRATWAEIAGTTKTNQSCKQLLSSGQDLSHLPKCKRRVTCRQWGPKTTMTIMDNNNKKNSRKKGERETTSSLFFVFSQSMVVPRKPLKKKEAENKMKT